MIRTVLAALVVILTSLAYVQGAAASGGPGTKTRLEARMRAGSTEAKVSFSETARGTSAKRSLEVEIKRGTANTDYPVLLNGVQIATVKTNAKGSGHLEIERNVPAMLAGDSVVVGTLSGALQAR